VEIIHEEITWFSLRGIYLVPLRGIHVEIIYEESTWFTLLGFNEEILRGISLKYVLRQTYNEKMTFLIISSLSMFCEEITRKSQPR